ncbi:transcriptional regulator NrdR [Ligilactobacillus equi]|uniref:Transcriptional repressor NrdR n=1 Tax=Ligilactobacillus equi DPC 6820 TaxID=1392007 RepID=V7HW05_9LACO|nr:transcriptional regulator NrdR [Ligilactobacillus equi]ETA74414.1 transcriptional regulator NrdR [Ligilactobacillus equi DPC 6820]
MKCPHCQNNSSRVIDSRPADDGKAIRRRRECEKCGFRFTTFERTEATPILVIKKDGMREEFNREKIRRGIIRAAEKRPVNIKQIDRIVEEVEDKIRAVGGNEVSSQLIGRYVMDILVDVDDITYIRFASVYRQFKDMKAFAQELQGLIARNEGKEAQKMVKKDD